MGRLGILSGTVSLRDNRIFEDLEARTMANRFGKAQVFCSDRIAFLPRHGLPPHNAIPPHRINHPANMQALKDLDVSEIIGINSTGSLKRDLKPGMLVIPDDFILLNTLCTIHRDQLIHITPSLHRDIRQGLMKAAEKCGIAVVEQGVYWQTKGPRLETRAEIRLMSQFADLVGMTMASEAVIAQELDLPYASLCTVDNFAHGLDRDGLTMEQIRSRAHGNAAAVLSIIAAYVDERIKKPQAGMA